MSFDRWPNTAALAILAASAQRMSLHSAAPDATGSAEISGGSPPYTRQPVTLVVDRDTIDLDTEPVFDLPAGITVTHIGWRTAGGLWLGGTALSSPLPTARQTQFTVTAALLRAAFTA